MSAVEKAPRASLPQAANRYVIGERIAEGGMAVIYKAYDTLARREVAYKRLKVVHESARPRTTALFEREYNALRQLKHPNIVEVYDYGLDLEGPFYTMELLAGSDLAQAAPLPLVDACRVLREVASALALVHARRLVHRDVTPANVRLTQDGRAKLIDFGVLSEFGVAKEVVGTPSFIAPELLSGELLDARTDLFALGALAYWALTRRLAYPARSVAELLETWQVPVVRPSLHEPELPKEIDELLLALLDREPMGRPTSAAHVMERLTAIAQLPPEPDAQEVAYSYLLHPPLVGRESVLAQLDKALREAAEGRGKVMLVESVPGLGRSALLDQLAVRAQLSGSNVLRFEPSGRREAGLAQAIGQWMRAVFPELWRDLLARFPVLSRETRAPLRAAPSLGDVTEQRMRLIAALQSCIDEIGKIAPFTLLVDDVQRADAESLALLGSLARAGAGVRALVVATHPSAQESGALADLRAATVSIILRPLTESDVESLALSVFGNVANAHRLARHLHGQSGGNPGQCMDMCRMLLQQGDVRYELGTFLLPFDPRVTAATGALELTRLTGLGARAIELAQLLSLHSAAIGCAQAASALRGELEALVAAAEELAGRGLVRLHDGAVALSSASLRDAIAGALSPAQVSALHTALAHSIVRFGDESIETKLRACHHLLLAGREDEAIALVWRPLQSTVIPLGATAVCVPVLELLLATQRKRGVADEDLWSVLHPLVVAGFWGELGSLNRHRDAALAALANLSGFALAKRLSPVIGQKLGLGVGVAYGIGRFLRTDKQTRPRKYGDTVERFLSAVTMSAATASSAFEPEKAWRTVSFLDPLAAMKPDSSGYVAREFALATAELASGQNTRATQRYEDIIALLAQKQVFVEVAQAGFVEGCAHGAAQGAAMAGEPNALAKAERLAAQNAFFKPHVETVRMTYYGLRGEQKQFEHHRKQAELFALQGGMSWTAFTLIANRCAYIAMLWQDTLGVLKASVELERLASLAPNALLFRDLCQAYVAMMRGQLDDAIAGYQRIAAHPHARLMRAWELDRAFYAEALLRHGRAQEAQRVCEEAIAVRREQGAAPFTLRVPTQVLALSVAKLGDMARAKALLAELSGVVTENGSPLAVGSLQRDLARLALSEADPSGFEQSFERMLAAFRATENPQLIQQCRRLLAEAEKSGVIAVPNWEKHQLLAPANTQDLVSQLPEQTEFVETLS